jgi:leader peptidase (prepilin peptidase)/N-methyltransferase
MQIDPIIWNHTKYLILCGVVILGFIMGSFMNVIIYRLPRGISIVKPGSFCPFCRKPLKFYDNIPFLSYLILKGRCRYCKNRISLQYPLVEGTYALTLLIIYLRFSSENIFVFYMILSFFLIAAAFCDIFTLLDNGTFDTGVIPDILVYAGIITGLMLTLFYKFSFIGSIAGIIVGFLLLFVPNILYKFFSNRDGIGGGDMKLLAMVGAFLGYKPLVFVLIVSSFLGAIIGLVIVIIKRNRNFPLPFAPFIVFATFIVIFFKDCIYNLLFQIYGIK